MGKIACAHCKRKENVGYYDHVDNAGRSLCIVFLCDICLQFMKSIDIKLDFKVDAEKLEALKKATSLNEERIETDTPPKTKKP
jgi:formate dehydrogenase maturation protein FdhE